MCYSTIDRYFRTALFLIVFCAALTSCEEKRQPATFYPVDSLISGQVGHLVEINAGLFKEALLSGKTDTATYVPGDTSAWLSELGIFRKLDIINKPVNKDSYEVNDGLFDPQSNLTVKAFTSLKKLPVVYLKIYYQGSLEKPRKIEALYDEGNVLYQSARLLSMHFTQIGNKTVMTRYSIKGGQKMVFGDSVAFFVSGKILVD